MCIQQSVIFHKNENKLDSLKTLEGHYFVYSEKQNQDLLLSGENQDEFLSEPIVIYYTTQRRQIIFNLHYSPQL